MKNLCTKTIALILVVAIVTPTIFFAAPPRANAAGSCIGGLIGAGVSAIGNAFSTAASVPNNSILLNLIDSYDAGADIESCVYDLVLMPLFRQMIRTLIQSLTASVVDWINGKKNGTGRPSYVGNLLGNLQTVGDTQALAFFTQFARNSNSPFSTTIIASLRNLYLQNTSAAGFWAANRNTLAQYSPNVNAFLAGDWSKGGVAAWFALTTQSQNNPYLLYQSAQGQLASLVSSASGARVASLGWGQGFLSWCGGTSQNVYPQVDDQGNPMPAVSTAAGDACYGADGVARTILTPGSVIHDYTRAAIADTPFQELVNVNDIDQAVATIVQALFNKTLMSAQGLLGASGSGSNNVTNQLRTYTPNSSGSGSSGSAANSADDVLTRLDSYVADLNKIRDAARTASTTLAETYAICTSAMTTGGAGTAYNYALEAQQAMPQVEKVYTSVQGGLDTAAATRKFALQVKAEAGGNNSAYASDLIKLISMPPQIQDIIAAQENARTTGQARTNPEGSLKQVSGGTPLDQMSLLTANAQSYKAQCAAFGGSPTPPDTGGGG